MIPKEIREKAELLIKFNDEIIKYFRREYNFKGDFDCLDIVNEPSGKKLQDGSYKCWYTDYYDTVYYNYYDTVYYRYFPMDNGKYLEIMYRK